MKKVLLSAIVLLAAVMTGSAQVTLPKETPQLEFALQLQVTLGETYQVGDTQHGQRIVFQLQEEPLRVQLLREPLLMVGQITSWPTKH